MDIVMRWIDPVPVKPRGPNRQPLIDITCPPFHWCFWNLHKDSCYTLHITRCLRAVQTIAHSTRGRKINPSTSLSECCQRRETFPECSLVLNLNWTLVTWGGNSQKVFWQLPCFEDASFDALIGLTTGGCRRRMKWFCTSWCEILSTAGLLNVWYTQ